MNFALTPLQLHHIPNNMKRRSTAPADNPPLIGSGSSLEAFPRIKSATLVIGYWPDNNDIEGFARAEFREITP